MSAIISPCGKYRYRLERQCAGAGSTAIIMINPSTADAEQDDATIRKLRGFGNRYEWGRIIIGNLFALRSTDVRALSKVHDPIGPDAGWHIAGIFGEADRCVFAWGPSAKLPPRLRNRWRMIDTLARDAGLSPMSIGMPAKDGHPCHPLMLPYSRELQPWRLA